MAALSISRDAVMCVRNRLRSFERDVLIDLSDLSDVIQDGRASDFDKEEYSLLCHVGTILSRFESVLSDFQNGGEK